MENFPFDKYELEPCALTAHLLNYKQGICWQVFISGSGGSTTKLGEPFGYLKASSATNTVNLVLLPYSYQKLWPLLGIQKYFFS